MRSLRLRVVAFTLAAVAAIWLGTAFVVWREAAHELAELIDHLPAEAQTEIAAHRDELIAEIAEHVAMPVLLALPLLAVLLAIAVTLALRPLQRLANDIGGRAPDRLDALEVAGAPAEIRPLIVRLNALFAAISRALENERRLTADAAHELRTPLAALKAQAQVARAADDEKQRHHALEQVVVGCDRATRLVEQLLQLARLDAAPATAPQEGVDLQEIAAEVLAGLAEPAVAKGIELTLTEPAGDVAPVRGDPLLLGALVRNLADNAVRYSLPGTPVQVTVKTHDGRITLTVSDRGPGIPDALRTSPGERFRRGRDAVATGSGLGLSIVMRIAALHGAHVTLQPGVDGSGTVATVAFPAAGAGKPASAP